MQDRIIARRLSGPPMCLTQCVRHIGMKSAGRGPVSNLTGRSVHNSLFANPAPRTYLAA